MVNKEKNETNQLSVDETCEDLLKNKTIQTNCQDEDQEDTRTINRGLLAQCILAAVVAVAGIGAGMPIGYSAILLPQLKTINGSLRIDDDMGSWIASLHSAATPAGAFLSGTLMDNLGRKVAIQVACVPLIVGWICICLSQSHATMLAGRVLAGAAVSLTLAPCQVYIAEIADPRIRGVLANVTSASYIFGILLVYIIGSIADWRLTAGLSTILPAAAALILFFLPETPVWLIRQNYHEKAHKACLWLRGGRAVQATTEIQQLMRRKQKDELRKAQDCKFGRASLTRPQIIKPFVIVNVLFTLQTLTGSYLIVFYAVDIISHLKGNSDNQYFGAVLTAGVRFVCTIIAGFLLAFVGRRALGLGSALGSALFALCLAALLNFNWSSNHYFTASCLLCYVAANTVGLLTVPGVVVAEVFPAQVRGLAVSLTYTILNLLIFAVTKIFPFLKNVLGIQGCFVLFGVSSLVTAAFIFCVLPETKGKSLNEIEDYFLQGNILWIARKKENRVNKVKDEK